MSRRKGRPSVSLEVGRGKTRKEATGADVKTLPDLSFELLPALSCLVLKKKGREIEGEKKERERER